MHPLISYAFMIFDSEAELFRSKAVRSDCYVVAYNTILTHPGFISEVIQKMENWQALKQVQKTKKNYHAINVSTFDKKKVFK